MGENEEREKWAFYLKRKGVFEEALRAYAREYASSLDGSPFIAELCFEEMFDIALLMYLRDGRTFESRRDLKERIQSTLVEALNSVEAYEAKTFEEQFRRCQGKLFPRGRAKSPFSVDSRLLLARKREALLRG